jgi:hypothetical protein
MEPSGGIEPLASAQLLKREFRRLVSGTEGIRATEVSNPAQLVLETCLRCRRVTLTYIITYYQWFS